jgi:hypothetical protein
MNLVRNQDAIDRALAARRHASTVPVRLRLHAPVGESIGFFSPCGITPFSSEKLRNELNKFLAGQASGLVTGGRREALLASEALWAQLPEKVTEFVLG